MAKFDKQSLCQKYLFWYNTSSCTCSLYLYLVDINVFAKFYKIPSLSGQVIKEPEDHWSCIAHLSAGDMLKSVVIEKKK